MPSDLQTNKDLIKRFVDEVFAEMRVDSVDALVADDFTSHTWPSTGEGKADLRAATKRISGVLADPVFKVQDMVAEGDRVAVLLTASATQVGEFMGLPASNRRYTIGEIHWFRVANGKIAEHWHQLDAMGMMSQLKGAD